MDGPIKVQLNLFEIVSRDLVSDAEKLLDNGHDINERLSSGDTVLHLAASFSSMEMILSLVRRGANLHSLNNSNVTPIHLSDININDNVKEMFNQLNIFKMNIHIFEYYRLTMNEEDAFFALCLEIGCESLFSYFDICVRYYHQISNKLIN